MNGFLSLFCLLTRGQKSQNSTSNVLGPQRPQKWLCQIFGIWPQVTAFLPNINMKCKSLGDFKVDPNLLSNSQSCKFTFYTLP